MLWPDTTDRDSHGRLTVGGIPLVDLAERFGTPLYVFDEATLRGRARAVKSAFAERFPRSRVLYAGKAYLSLAVARLMHEEDLGFDVVSGGELFVALRAGVPSSTITFHGSNKSVVELEEALDAGVGLIAVDNHLELANLARLARARGTRVPLLLRLNPGVDVHTHDKIKTGVIDSKFGFPLWSGDARDALERAVGDEVFDVRGIHAHLGSQLFDVNAAAVALRLMLDFAAAARSALGWEMKVISTGGGFGIAYAEDDAETSASDWAEAISTTLIGDCERHGLPLPEIVVEPGRWIVGPSAVALYRVGARKAIPGVRTYVSVDGGMGDNIRPALYDARYAAALANRPEQGAKEVVTIAGRYCESGDVLIEDISLPVLEAGDLLAVPAVGAYCLPMASNYNHALRPAAVMVRDGATRLIRRRETYDDLLQTEVAAP